MLQAITTKFLGPTDSRGARVKARAQAGSVTVPWNHALGVEDNHIRAAQALAIKMDWQGNWRGGALPDDTGYAFVRSSAVVSGHAFAMGAETSASA
jgi:hypothetical protein